ncbi:unnamed protein product [Rhizophagus irregularis]|nr:unnamed protein product [Rhizophagus irregularis]
MVPVLCVFHRKVSSVLVLREKADFRFFVLREKAGFRFLFFVKRFSVLVLREKAGFRFLFFVKRFSVLRDHKYVVYYAIPQ